MPLMEISVVPIGTKGPSVRRYVAGVIKLLKNEKKIEYEINPTLNIYKEREVVDQIIGVTPSYESDIKKKIKPCLEENKR